MIDCGSRPFSVFAAFLGWPLACGNECRNQKRCKGKYVWTSTNMYGQCLNKRSKLKRSRMEFSDPTILVPTKISQGTSVQTLAHALTYRLGLFDQLTLVQVAGIHQQIPRPSYTKLSTPVSSNWTRQKLLNDIKTFTWRAYCVAWPCPGGLKWSSHIPSHHVRETRT